MIRSNVYLATPVCQMFYIFFHVNPKKRKHIQGGYEIYRILYDV